jgi:hypothetical protein
VDPQALPEEIGREGLIEPPPSGLAEPAGRRGIGQQA